MTLANDHQHKQNDPANNVESRSIRFVVAARSCPEPVAEARALYYEYLI
jgi:hypothetical protein